MGFNFRSFLKVAELVAGPALAAAGVPPLLIPIAIHGIQLAESRPGTGAEKKAVALDAVQTAITGINAVKPNTVDPNVVSIVDEGIDAAVGAVNAVAKRPISVS
jgi:hypothetical protein